MSLTAHVGGVQYYYSLVEQCVFTLLKKSLKGEQDHAYLTAGKDGRPPSAGA